MLVFALLLVAGCKVDPVEETTIDLSDANNYSIESSITSTTFEIPSCQDALVDWSGLTADLQGKPMDPTTDVTTVQIVRFGSLTVDQILDGINTDSLKQSDVTGAATFNPVDGDTDAWLSEFKFFNVSIDPAEEVCAGMGTFLVSILTDTSWYRSFVFFIPTEGAPETTIVIDATSANLTLDVDLSVGERLAPELAYHYIVDWSGLTTDGYGREIDLSNIDTMILGRYIQTAAELESEFVWLVEMADPLYTASIEGVGSYDLMDLATTEGASFPGFEEEDEATWILALQCSSCINPAPPFLATFE